MPLYLRPASISLVRRPRSCWAARVSFAIRPYEARDERGWLICRLLSFFDTAFFDAVEREKERYDRDAIELVAEKDGSIVGLLDLECESDGLSARPGAGGMIWHLATHPITSDGESHRRSWRRQSSRPASGGSFASKRGRGMTHRPSAGTSVTGSCRSTP